MTGATVKNARNTFTDANVSVIKGTVDKLIQKLGPEFFDDKKTTEATREATMKAVVDKFDRFVSLDPAEIQKQMDASIAKRNGAISNAADQDTAAQTPINREATNTNPIHPETNEPKCTFDPGDLVIGKHDPIMIFAHNPYTEADEWYPVFCGFINTANERTDETTGESSITLQCYCVRALMKQMRVVINPAIAQIEPDVVFGQKDAGYFADLLNFNSSGFTDATYGLPLEQIVCLLVTGSISSKVKSDLTSAPDGQEASTNFVSGKTNSNAIGRFFTGEVMRYEGAAAAGVPASTGEDSKTLEEWHALTVFGPDKKFMPESEVNEIGLNSYIGGSFDPWTRQMHFLLPSNGSNVKNLSELVVADNLQQFQFSNRWEMIHTLARLLDYQFMTTPFGDLILEFPMYDFVPEDFGTTWTSMFKYFGHLIDSAVTPEAETVPAGVVLTGAINPLGVAGQSDSLLLRVLAYSKTVAAKYGVAEIEHQAKPFLNDIDRLKAYAAITYQRMLANASNLSFTATHRPFLMPNRPILHERRNRLGISYSVEHTWELGGVVSTEIAIRCIRKKVIKDGQASYRFVTGGTQMSVSYRVPAASIQLSDDTVSLTQGAQARAEQLQSSGNETPVIDPDKIIDTTARVESGGDYSRYTENDNNHGIAFGLIQFNQEVGTLDVLFKRMHSEDAKQFNKIAGKFATNMLDSKWVKQTDLNADPEFQPMLKKLGAVPAFQQVQRDLAKSDYFNPAAALCSENNLRSERAHAMLFDSEVQMGHPRTERFIKQAIKDVGNDDEKAILTRFAELADDFANSHRREKLLGSSSLSDDTGIGASTEEDEDSTASDSDETTPPIKTVPLSSEQTTGITVIDASGKAL